jgi:hypothetical protein
MKYQRSNPRCHGEIGANRILFTQGDSLVRCPIRFRNFAQWDSTKKMACNNCMQAIEFKAELAPGRIRTHDPLARSLGNAMPI